MQDFVILIAVLQSSLRRLLSINGDGYLFKGVVKKIYQFIPINPEGASVNYNVQIKQVKLEVKTHAKVAVTLRDISKKQNLSEF